MTTDPDSDEFVYALLRFLHRRDDHPAAWWNDDDERRARAVAAFLLPMARATTNALPANTAGAAELPKTIAELQTRLATEMRKGWEDGLDRALCELRARRLFDAEAVVDNIPRVPSPWSGDVVVAALPAAKEHR